MSETNKLYKCMLHSSNEGFFSEQGGDWICWICWTSNPLNDPKGRMIEQLKTKRYILRIVDRSMYGQNIGLELYDLSSKKNEKCIYSNVYRDLSVALRKYKSLFSLIKKRKLNKNNIRSNPNPYDFLNLSRERPILEMSDIETPRLIQQERDVEIVRGRDYTGEHIVNAANVAYHECNFTDCTIVGSVMDNCLLNNCIIEDSVIRNESELRRCTWRRTNLSDDTIISDD